VPIPKAVARFNHAALNPLMRHVAGWAPGFGIVEHVGRRSGRTHATPVNVFRAGERYVFALTYGTDAQWVQNVLAAGGCVLRSERTTVRLTAPERFRDSERRLIPAPARWVLALIGVDEFLALRGL
jgi:deazaflavin-dependent oxidoreductase (nitroreductase family)